MAATLDQIDCVLLDRDGVINFDSEDYIKHPDEWQPIPGALDAIVRLQSVVDVAVCTNQSGVGRGLYDLPTLADIHAKMCDELTALGGAPINIHFCPHAPDASCNCRKPKPGLLQDALANLGRVGERTIFVGDSHRDLQAAVAAGCAPVLVLTGNGQKTASSLSETTTTFVDLAQLADVLLTSH